MTANECARSSSIGFDNNERERLSFMSVELLDRIDEIVWFEPLSKNALETIAANCLSDLSARLCEKGYTLSYDDMLLKRLAQSCKTKKGARSLKNEIRRTVEQPIAADILNGKLKRGDKITL